MRLVLAVREAWWTFLLTLWGWRVDSYSLPVRPGYGRAVGRVSRWLPTYPGWKDGHGWRLSSEGESWSREWTRPTAAVRADAPATRRIYRRLDRERTSPTWVDVSE